MHRMYSRSKVMTRFENEITIIDDHYSSGTDPGIRGRDVRGRVGREILAGRIYKDGYFEQSVPSEFILKITPTWEVFSPPLRYLEECGESV